MTLMLMPPICLLLLAASSQVADAQTADAGSLLHGGLTWQQFLSGVTVQRELWLRNAAAATVPAGLSERMTRASKGLRFLIVAEDRCTDSVNTVPYIARLASSAHVDLRVLDRAAGELLLEKHRASDGWTVTPVVVLVRNGRDVGAWVERPAVLQKLFLSMAADREDGRRLAERQSWYDSDRGRTALEEVVALAERIAARR